MMPVEVLYSNHCYSRKPRRDINEKIPDGHLIMDGSTERMFCPRRYQLSRSLPRIIEALVRSDQQIWSITGGNYVKIDTVEESADGVASPVTYYVLMRIWKEAKPNQQKHIKVRVETAYPEDILFDPVRRKKAFNFRILLREIWDPRA
ncbi:hypothetical protein [Burkholderia gladioli]|uniref:Uncharacterized protein n=1 Tax=Burkholderia gladioli TaxID=28095 RepID=A0AB38U619_BURGA|nr:hypothetical protein [Burkholderia gladioli]AYQ85982.1 hypothetical protein EDD84_00100 [Burkholderia gladioli]UWX75434.1 hypothetical protein NYZ96_36045 [Burkholderia gladioli]